MNIMPTFLLESVLPALLFPFLIALVAVLGIARWKRTILALAIVALLLLIAGVLALRYPGLQVGGVNSLTVYEQMQVFAIAAINCSSIISGVGVVLALILTAHARQWTWFAILLIAAVISTIAGIFVPSFFGLYALIGLAQAQTIFHAPLYAIVTTILAGLIILAQLAYALFSPRATPAATSIATMPDDVTLP